MPGLALFGFQGEESDLEEIELVAQDEGSGSVTPLRSASMMEHSNNPDDDYTHDRTARILA